MARAFEMGETTLAASPAAVGKLIEGETERWEKVIRIKPEEAAQYRTKIQYV